MTTEDRLNEANEKAMHPAGAEPVSPQQLIAELEKSFRALAVGLVITNPLIKQSDMWEAIAVAMGSVLSAVTQSQDLTASIRTRTHLVELVTDAIKKRYPPTPTQQSGIIRPAGVN